MPLRFARMRQLANTLSTKMRRLAQLEQRLEELTALLSAGDIRAAPAVAAVLHGRRLSVVPVIIDGVRRWGLSGWIPSGYVLGLDPPHVKCNDAAQGSGRAPPTGAFRASGTRTSGAAPP